MLSGALVGIAAGIMGVGVDIFLIVVFAVPTPKTLIEAMEGTTLPKR